MNIRSVTVRLLSLLLLVATPGLAQEPGRTPVGIITGRIANATTDEGLPQSRVELLGGNRATVGNAVGRFRLDSISPGTWSIRVTAIGFEPLVIANLIVGSGKPVEVAARLEPRAVALEELTVEAEEIASPIESSTSTASLTADDVRRAPGVLEDVVRATALLPGVSVTSGGRNDLAVRGGAPYENLFLVDNLEVPNINHFGAQGSTGGAVSILNIDLIREVTFSSGGYGAQYGDRTASVTGLNLREGNSERLAGSVNLSATGLWAIGEGPLGENGTFVASVRRSYLDLIFKLADFAFVPEYWDAQVKVTQRFGTKDALSLLFVGALDNVSLNNDTEENRADNAQIAAPNQQSYFSGITWKHSLPSGLLAITAGRSWTRFNTVQGDSAIVPDTVYANRSEEGDNSLRTDLTLDLSRSVQLLIGNTARYASRLRYDVELVGTVRYDANFLPQPLSVDTAFTAFRNATYAEGRIFAGPVRLVAGVRGDYYGFLGNTVRVAPRLGANIPLDGRTALNLSAGRYYQAPSFIWLVGDPNNRNTLTPIRSDQLVAGLARGVAPDLTAQVELYYKKYQDYPARLFRPQAVLQPTGFDDVTTDIPAGLEPLSSIGEGASYGAEVLLQKRLGAVPVYGLVSLSFNRSEFSGVDGVRRPGAFETRFVGNFLAGWRLNPKWELSGKFRLATGLPYTPFYPAGSSLEGLRDFEQYNTLNLPTFHALDVRVDRRWSFRGTQLAVYLDVQNIYNQKNVTNFRWNYATGEAESDTQIGILPSIGVFVEF